MSPEKIMICGGDIRSVYMAKFLIKQGKDVKLCALDKISKKHSVPEEELSDIKDIDAVIFGLPAVKNDMTINAPFCDESIQFESILKQMDKKTLLAGGRFSDSARKLAEEYGIRLLDYSTDEVFQIENAFYTAEGAVETIIKNTVKSTSELKILIIGYGRISKALCSMLASFGSEITVYARKAEQRAWASMLGCNGINDLTNLEKYDVIVNTVPYELLHKNQLETVKEDGLVIDLSARPGYVSKEICEKLKIKLIFLPGLPAASAPCSAGEAAARAVVRMCSEI